MKRLYLFFILLSILSCDTPETNEIYPIHTTSFKSFKPSISDNDLFTIQNEILEAYAQNPLDSNALLKNKIVFLDSISELNLDFKNLKIVNYSLPTPSKIDTFLNNYENNYENLNITDNCKNILDLLINNQIGLNNLQSYVTDKNIDINETELLFYVAFNLKDSEKNDGIDWKKKRTVFMSMVT